MSKMFGFNWTWTLPWTEGENLFGILIANNVPVVKDGESASVFSGTIVAIGILFGRLDLLFNITETKEEDNE